MLTRDIVLPNLRARSKRNNNQILHGDRTRCGENFVGRLRMPTRELFAVADLLVL